MIRVSNLSSLYREFIENSQSFFKVVVKCVNSLCHKDFRFHNCYFLFLIIPRGILVSLILQCNLARNLTSTPSSNTSSALYSSLTWWIRRNWLLSRFGGHALDVEKKNCQKLSTQICIIWNDIIYTYRCTIRSIAPMLPKIKTRRVFFLPLIAVHLSWRREQLQASILLLIHTTSFICITYNI